MLLRQHQHKRMVFELCQFKCVMRPLSDVTTITLGRKLGSNSNLIVGIMKHSSKMGKIGRAVPLAEIWPKFECQNYSGPKISLFSNFGQNLSIHWKIWLCDCDLSCRKSGQRMWKNLLLNKKERESFYNCKRIHHNAEKYNARMWALDG